MLPSSKMNKSIYLCTTGKVWPKFRDIFKLSSRTRCLPHEEKQSILNLWTFQVYINTKHGFKETILEFNQVLTLIDRFHTNKEHLKQTIHPKEKLFKQLLLCEVWKRHSTRHAEVLTTTAQYAFKISMIHWVVQFALRIAVRSVLHRYTSLEIHR